MSAPDTRRILDVCARCGPEVRQRPVEQRRHTSRGLCRACESWVRTRGDITDYPRSTWTVVDLVDAACILRQRHGAPDRTASRPFAARCHDGKSWTAIAAMLDVAPAALEKARERCGWPDPTLGRPARDPAEVAAERAARRTATPAPAPASTGPDRPRGRAMMRRYDRTGEAVRQVA